MISLYLLSHQDDELGLFHELSTAPQRGERAVCAFLTDGGWAGVHPEVRNAESRRVLSRLGVMDSDIHFVGHDDAIPDGRLVEHLELALASLSALAARYGVITRVVTQAWEGGHQDHDAAHLLGRALAKRLSVEETSRQFHLYRFGRGTHMAYASPLPEDGPVERTRIPFLQRILYPLLVRHYRSQANVMLGLFPHIVYVYAIEGVQKLQHLPAIDKLSARPAARLLYEHWQLYTYETFARFAHPFIAKHVATYPPAAADVM